MSGKHNTSESKSRLLRLIIGVLVLLVIVVGLYWFSQQVLTNIKNNDSTNHSSTYKGGPGGDPKLVISYNNQAKAAWVAGDKQKAKELAKKGLKASAQLTIAQQRGIPDQMGVVVSLYNLSKGRGPLE